MIDTLLGETLEAIGHSICAIDSTESAAVTAALTRHPALMIIDAQIDDGSGVAALETIHGTRRIPCILVSGDTAGLRATDPCIILLAKPYSEAELESAIMRASTR